MQTDQQDLDLYAVRAEDMTEHEWSMACVCKWRRDRLMERARMEQAERKTNDEGED